MLRHIWKPHLTTVDFRVYQLTPGKLPHHFEVTANILSKQRLQEQLIELLQRECFCDADRLQRRYPLLVPFPQYRLQKQIYIERALLKRLELYNFQRADAIFKETAIFPRTKYETLKAEYISRFAKSTFGLNLIQEQVAAVANTADNLLIKARAGSGKTAVMACKAATLLSQFQGNPDSILVLAFNKKAAEEIGERIGKPLGIQPNARTFHSLAHRIVQPIEKILFDDDGGSAALTNFVQNLLEEIQNNNAEVRPLIRQFLRSSFNPRLVTGSDKNNQNEYQNRRNQAQVTLKGEKVKSNGEKYIADFLFEHNISYSYEEPMSGPDGMIRPDFKLWDVNKNGQRCILEHWGIDEHDPLQRTPDQWNMSWTQYKSLMNKKRQWYKTKNQLLIETSILDLQNGREAFEDILATRLSQAGIYVERLPDEVILSSLMEKQSKGFAGLVQQAISRAKRSGLEPEDVKRLIETTASLDERTSAFWKVALIVYSRYQAKLVQEGFIDFDDLIQRAVQIIDQTAGNCHFKVNPGRSIAVRDLQYLLIDEYQDFSQLFYDLVQSIRRQNPMLRILCVGDDWQAINGFAGSHLRYFYDFKELFPIAESTTLLTNHRSHSQIVQQSNKFMYDQGDAAVPRSDLGEGEARRILIENIWLPPKDGNTFTQLNYHFADFDPAFLSAKFIKACYQIITTPRNRGKTCVILSRTNWIYRRPVVEFKKKLKELLDEEEYKLISFSTIHSYKGLEADITIIADASSENFPFIHPDNQLLSPLGVTIEEVIKEEKRLFYVAMTRAKEQLYVFTEKDAMSSFIKHLPSANLDDVAPSMISQDLWVGISVSGTKETYVYDPALATPKGDWVHLYQVEKDHIAKYHIGTLKPLIKTVTKNKEGEAALQQYMQWKNSDRGRKYVNYGVTDHFSKKVDWVECPCAICSGTPHLDPLFISAFEPISMEHWVAEIADMRREKESLRRRS